MIQWMIRQACSTWTINKPRIVIGVPSGITQVEKRAVMDAALAAGARKVMLVEEPTAAALGAGLPVDSPSGCMIVDIGGGTTDVAILSMNATVYSQSVRVAGDEMDEAIQRHIKREHGFITGIYEAERIKLIIGSALPFGKPRTVTVFGRYAATGMPGQIEVTDEFIRHALNEPISAIISAVQMALEQTSPEMAHDIVSQGIHIAGGGALLKGLAERLTNETGIQFHRTQDPLSCVVRGVGRIVENLEEFGELCVAEGLCTEQLYYFE
jgi:rod shape-determining protein MreB